MDPHVRTAIPIIISYVRLKRFMSRVSTSPEEIAGIVMKLRDQSNAITPAAFSGIADAQNRSDTEGLIMSDDNLHMISHSSLYAQCYDVGDA